MHLTYCSNVHPGETWAETLGNLRQHATAVKARWRPDAPMGVGLRLSARAAEELLEQPDGVEEARAELAQLGMYVFTINGFPYGDFHGTRVKEDVYRPDWRTSERGLYTRRLADVLAGLLPTGVLGSISTVPVGFRPAIGGPDSVLLAVKRLHECVAHLWRQREAGGTDIALALEPEPMCFLETTAEGVAFIEREVLGAESVREFAVTTGLSRARAEETLRHHLGICLDTCHAAVEFEEPREAVRALARAGVRLAKVQATAGLQVDALQEAQCQTLREFADDVYLHQVVAACRGERGEQRLVRFLDLHEALASLSGGEHRPESWRVHFHVPIFETALGLFTNTRSFLQEALDEVIALDLCEHIEVETYTWSVLPERYRTMPLTEMIVGELVWVEQAVAGSMRRRG